MRNEITKRNVLIVAFSLLIFLIISVMVNSYQNRKNTESNLINISQIVISQVEATKTTEDLEEVIRQFSKNSNWLRISIYNSTGHLIMDSHTDEVDTLSNDELKYINAVVPKPYIRTSPITNEKAMYYGVVINQDIILRTSIPLTDNSEQLLSGIFFTCVLIVFVVLISLVFTKKTADTVMATFKTIIENLKRINEGHYVPIVAHHKYPEVEEALIEIEDLNNKISNSFIAVVNERDKLNFILDNINQGILIIDVNGSIIVINQKFKDIFELSGNLLNRNYKDVIKIIEIEEIITKTLNFKSQCQVDYHHPVTDKIYSFNTSMINRDWISNEANFSGIVLLVSDVTEERKNSQIKDEFIANASHELKTPITSISGFSELITSGMVKDEKLIQEYIKRIGEETKKMKRLIDNLLSLSSLERGRNPEEEINLNIKDIVYDIKKSYIYQLDSNNIEMILDLEDAYITANPQLIYHLISNLVDNAIKYNKPGGFIKITLKNYKKNKVLIIEDSGIGIDKKYLERVFARFFRVDNSRSRLTGGSGLGLSIVKKICQLYDASIKVESKVDVGTKITITF